MSEISLVGRLNTTWFHLSMGRPLELSPDASSLVAAMADPALVTDERSRAAEALRWMLGLVYEELA